MADTREKGTLIVDVTGGCDEDYLTPCYLTMELDDEYNSGNTCFAVGSIAYFRVYGNASYTCKATLGTPRLDNRGVGEVITEEYVDFTNWAASTTYPVEVIRSYDWIGRSLGTIEKQKGSNALLADKTKADGFGVAQITYTTRYDRWKISSPSEADIMVYAVGTGDCEDTKASLTIQFRDDCEGVQNNYVTLTFKDYITGAIITGASVWVDGVYRGTTDSNGQIYLGLMTSGTHTIRATHPSYSGTEADLLGNDSFVVSG